MQPERLEQPWTIGRAAELVRRWPVRVALTLLVALGGAILWIGVQDPEYRAQATLLLDPKSAMSSKASLLQGLDLSGEIAVMRSHDVLAATISAPLGGSLAAPVGGAETDIEDGYVRLGLATTTDDIATRPLAATLLRLLGRSAGAGWLRADARGDLDGASIEMLGPSRVRVSLPSAFGLVSRPFDLDFTPGEPIVVGGAGELRLWPEGDATGQTFLLRVRSEAEALKALRASIEIEREGRATRVATLSVKDTDPHRAAQIANAIARNYLEATRRRAQRQASSTSRFIEEQLEVAQDALEEASKELAALQSEIPDAMVPEQTTGALLVQVRALQSELGRIAIAEQSFAEALSLLAEGDETALSRLDPRFLDPISQRYLSAIAELNTQSAMQERSDTGSYRYMLQTRVNELENEEDRIRSERDAIRAVIAQYEAGDHGVFSRLVNPARNPIPLDPMTSVLMSELGRLQVLRDQKESMFTDQHPDVMEAREAIAGIEVRIVEHLRSRIASQEESLSHVADLAAQRRELLTAQPGQEREAIAEAVEDLRAFTETNLEGRIAALAAEKDNVAAELARVEEELARLPEEARRIAVPKGRFEAQAALVQFLTRNFHEARVAAATPMELAELVDPATPPNSRRSPSLLLALLLASVLGGIAGLWHAAWCEETRGRVRSEEELAATSGLPVLATLHLGAARGDVLADTGLRALRTTLLSASNGVRRADVGRVVMITSSGPGEGRGRAALGLARACDAAGDSAVVVDLDSSAPILTAADAAEGAADVLCGRQEWPELMRVLPRSGASLLPAGAADPRRGQLAPLLSPAPVQGLLTDLARAYDVVIVRLPPVSASPEVALLAPFADAALLVTRADGPSRPLVERSAAQLRDVSLGALGAVLVVAARRRLDPRAEVREVEHATA